MARSLSLDDILSAAENILRASGAEALSMRTVAREANLAHSGLYNYVSNRSELLTILAERMWNRHVGEPEGGAKSVDAAIVALISVIRQDPPMANLLRELLKGDRTSAGVLGRLADAIYPRSEELSQVDRILLDTMVAGLLDQGAALQILTEDQAFEAGARLLRMVEGDTPGRHESNLLAASSPAEPAPTGS